MNALTPEQREIVARLQSGRLMICEGQGDPNSDGCGGQGYTGASGQEPCRHCFGAGVMTPELGTVLSSAALRTGINLTQVIATCLWLDAFGADARISWDCAVRQSAERGTDSAAAEQVFRFRERAQRITDAVIRASKDLEDPDVRWSAWPETDADSDPSDPDVTYYTEWFVGRWPNGSDEADCRILIGMGRAAEIIARRVAEKLTSILNTDLIWASVRDRSSEAAETSGSAGGKSPAPQGAAP